MREAIFSRNTRIVREKMFGKKSSENSAKKRFFNIHTNIMTKNWRNKTRETIFP